MTKRSNDETASDPPEKIAKFDPDKKKYFLSSLENHPNFDKKRLLNLVKDQYIEEVSKSFYKVIKFSSEWLLDEVLSFLHKLSSQEWSNLFGIIIEGCSSQKSEDFTQCLMRFGDSRPVILQLTSQDKKEVKVYIKDEIESTFTDIGQDNEENSEKVKAKLSFLRSYLGGEFKILEQLTYSWQHLIKSTLILKFLKLFDNLFFELVLEVTRFGTKSDFLYVLETPIEHEGRILSKEGQIYLSNVYFETKLKNNEKDNESSAAATSSSVLLTAIEHSNGEIIDYLITYWTHLIQQLPVDHQVEISTAALKTDQFDVLCDLLEIADFPFPEDYEVDDERQHERLRKITLDRIAFMNAIKMENFKKIDRFIDSHMSLRYVYSTDNDTALTHAVVHKKFGVFYYLRSLGFQGERNESIVDGLDKEDRKKATKQAVKQRKANVSQALVNVNRSVMLLATRSLIHNRRLSKEQEAEYRQKIINWLQDIYKVAPEILNVAASCEHLKIIFDFESCSVDNIDLKSSGSLGLTRQTSRVIFIGAMVFNKKRDQQIKGVLARELCHYVMCLIYENSFLPYFKNAMEVRYKFYGIVTAIDKWSAKNSERPDDECNGNISSVFTYYNPKTFHLTLIAGAVQNQVEFDDNKNKSAYLEVKYKVLYDFWQEHVLPDLQSYFKRNKKVIKLNKVVEFLPRILNKQQRIKSVKNVEYVFTSKLTVVKTNVPTLLFLDIVKELKKKCGALLDSQNFFTEPQRLNNKEIWNDFNEVCKDAEQLNIFLDCTKGVPSYFGNIFVNKELNFIFIVSNDAQNKELMDILDRKYFVEATNMEINYNWNELTGESQGLLLHTKINFQSDSKISLEEVLLPKIIKVGKALYPEMDILPDLSEIMDENLLNLMIDEKKITINFVNEFVQNEAKNQFVFIERNFLKIVTDKSSTKSTSKISKAKLLQEIENKNHILISDKAGSGKSFAMKNFTKILCEQNPSSWVTYVDLKQFLKEFKAQMSQKEMPEFSTFMAEKILRTEHKFESKIFQKLYKDGKVFILFDGFDEIAPNCAEFVSNLAQSFQSNGGNQLWIATRDYFEVELMEKLKIDVAYSFDELTEDEGVNFVAKNWVIKDFNNDNNVLISCNDFNEHLNKSEDNQNYQQKARKIIIKAMLGKNMTADLEILKIIVNDFKGEKDFNNATKTVIFERYIEVLYKKWSQEKGEIRQRASLMSQKKRFNFWRIHQFHALISLFPEVVKEYFPDYNEREWPVEEVVACGILTIKDGKINFINETIRDFFVADLIVRELKISEQRKTILKMLIKILTSRNYSTIQIFLNDAIEADSSLLIDLGNDFQKFANEFSEMDNFDDYFNDELEVLIKMIMDILKSTAYEYVKKLLTKSAIKLTKSAKTAEVFIKFEDILFSFVNLEDLRALIRDQEILHRIIQSNHLIDAFESLSHKVAIIFGKETIREMLSTKSSYFDGNIIYLVCKSANKESCNISKCISILKNSSTLLEIVEQMSDCNQNGESILHLCAQMEDEECLKLVWQEIKNILSPQLFKELLFKKSLRNKGNILHFAALNTNNEIHKTTLALIVTILEDKKELQNLVCEKELDGYNYLHFLVILDDIEITEHAFNFLKVTFSPVQFNEVLNQKDMKGRNLLQVAIKISKNFQVFEFIWKTFEQLLNSNIKFLQLIKEVDRNSNNLVHFVASFGTRNVFEFVTKEIEKITSTNKFRNILNILGEFGQNILQLAAAHNRSYEFHELLWSVLKKYFEETIKNLIMHVDEYKENVLMKAVKTNSKQIVILTWNEIKIILNPGEQRNYLIAKSVKGETVQNMCTREDLYNWVSKLLETNELYSNSESSEVESEINSDESMDGVEDYQSSLIKAAKNNNLKKVERILKNGVDVNFQDKRELCAIDYAWTNYVSDNKDSMLKIGEKIMMTLFRANSCCPKWSFSIDYEQVNSKIQNVIDLTDQIKEIMEEYPNLRYFSERKTSKVLVYALRLQRCIVNQQMNAQTQNDFENHPPVHILKLLLKSTIPCANNNISGFHYVHKTLSTINRIKDYSNFLKIAAFMKYDIIFDFEQEIEQLNIPQYSSESVFIGAKGLLNAEKAHKVGGIILKKIAQNVINLIFMNNSLPYPKSRTDLMNRFGNIFDEIKQMNQESRKIDGSFKDIFELNNQNQPAELVVTAMQLVAQYFHKPYEIDKLEKKHTGLYDYLKDVVITECKKVLPVLKLISSKRVSLDNATAFNCLTDFMKEGIMEKQIKFQGKMTTISEFEEIAENFHILLDTNDLNELLLSNKILEIGEPLHNNPNQFKIERKFIRVSANENEPNTEETTEQIIEQLEKSKVFILSDLPKSGATTTFEQLAVFLKNKFEDHWVIHVKIEDCIKIIRKYKNNLVASQVPKFLADICQLTKSIELGTFYQLYEVGKIIFLFDKMLHESQNIFNIVFRDFTNRNINMILISTKPHNSADLRNIFNVDLYSFVPLTKDEKSNINNMMFAKYNLLRNVDIGFFRFISNYSIDNHFLLEHLINVYLNNPDIFNLETLNVYKIIDSVVIRIAESLTQIAFKNEEPDAGLQYLALKFVFKDKTGREFVDFLQNIPELSQWNNLINRLTIDDIENIGLVFKDIRENIYIFDQRIMADFFVIKYFKSILCNEKEFEDNDNETIFELLRSIAILSDEMRTIHTIFYDYSKYKSEVKVNNNFQLYLWNNFSQICDDISNSENKVDTFKFWLTIMPDLKDTLELNDDTEVTIELTNEKVELIRNNLLED